MRQKVTNYNNFINDFSYTAELRTLSTCFCCIGFVAAWLAVVGDIVAWLSAAWKCLRGRASFNRTMSRELRAIVDIMNQILEAPEQVPAEPYKQGELGELYTNLYKLVQALKESNRKEQEEKIFLRDIMSDISHQLKTPLASLTVFLDLLYDGRVPDVDKQETDAFGTKNSGQPYGMDGAVHVETCAYRGGRHPV